MSQNLKELFIVLSILGYLVGFSLTLIGTMAASAANSKPNSNALLEWLKIILWPITWVVGFLSLSVRYIKKG